LFTLFTITVASGNMPLRPLILLSKITICQQLGPRRLKNEHVQRKCEKKKILHCEPRNPDRPL
jgi:hypothetical protein